jgi:hypothetical protein
LGSHSCCPIQLRILSLLLIHRRLSRLTLNNIAKQAAQRLVSLDILLIRRELSVRNRVCFTGRNALSRRSLPAYTSGNINCYNPCNSFASNEVKTKDINKELRDQIFADRIRTLTESFEPKLSSKENLLFRESGGYLWRPRPDRSLMTSQT